MTTLQEDQLQEKYSRLRLEHGLRDIKIDWMANTTADQKMETLHYMFDAMLAGTEHEELEPWVEFPQ